MSTSAIPPMSPANLKALRRFQEDLEQYMHTRWDNAEAMEDQPYPQLIDFAVVVQMREIDHDGSLIDQYAVVRNSGQAPHVTKGLLNEGIETIQEEQVAEDED